MIKVHVYFSGIVQGVGFRYAVHRYATALSVVGFVRNLPDGRVEMKAEGDKAILSELINRITAHFEGSLSGKQIYWEKHLEGFKSFEITF